MTTTTQFDLIISNGLIFDGSGADPFTGDVAITGDLISAVSTTVDGQGRRTIDASGLAVAPGFINILSWSGQSLIHDPHSQSEIRQGVTLEVMGEGHSMGPLSAAMKEEVDSGRDLVIQSPHLPFAVEWSTLGEYLEWMEHRGVSPNIASFIGAATVRINVVGYERRPPKQAELARMKDLVREAMEEGAMGVASALIYPPGAYADTDELIALAEASGEYNGLYASHIRNESSHLTHAIDELVEIARSADVKAEVFHLKAAGESNWHLLDEAIDRIETARAEGLHITADMYPYESSGTGLTACLPHWAEEGGFQALILRLADRSTRVQVIRDMKRSDDGQENIYTEVGPEQIIPVGFQTERLQPFSGMSLASIAGERRSTPEDTLLDLIIEDQSRIFTRYPTISETNIRKQMQLPWIAFCSDGESQSAEGAFLRSVPHPRAFGSFARVLSKYVREERLFSLPEAIRRMTALPADNLGLQRRGMLRPGYYGDIVVFDPNTIRDHATWQEPRRYATGVHHVLVNGVSVLSDGEHTGATPGRFVRGPGAE